MNEQIEHWRQVFLDWMNANPLAAKIALIVAGGVIGLWLLVNLVRLVTPNKKARRSVDAQERAAVREEVEEAFPSPYETAQPLEDGDDQPQSDTLGDWPYPTAPESDPRADFPHVEPKASQTAPPVEAEQSNDPAPEAESPGAVAEEDAPAPPPPQPAPAAPEDIAAMEEAPAPDVEKSVTESEPFYAEPVIDYSDFAGASPIEEETADEDEGVADLEFEDELFEEAADFSATGVVEDQEDTAFENALSSIKRSAGDANGIDSSDHNVTEMNNPLAFLKKEKPPEPDVVDVSVFTPKRVQPAQAFILQAIFHVEEQKPEVASIAAAIDPDADHRVSKTLRQAVNQGQIITASLDIPEATIDQPVQAFVWRGDIEPLQFIVTIPAVEEAMSVLAKLQIALDGVPVASAVWRIVLSPEADVVNEIGEYIPIQRYRRAFVSYSSKDRVEVLKRVQGLQAAGLDVFQDVLDLDPGERWSNALYRNIDEADAFYLFWSENSASSEWVAKEWRYALERSITHPDKRPDICPVILTAPPPMPPAELADRHFNDILAYVLKAHESGANS